MANYMAKRRYAGSRGGRSYKKRRYTASRSFAARRGRVFSGAITSAYGRGGVTYQNRQRGLSWVRRSKRNILNTSIGSVTVTSADESVTTTTTTDYNNGVTCFVPYLTEESLDFGVTQNTVRIKGGTVKFLISFQDATPIGGHWMVRCHRVVSREQVAATELNQIYIDFTQKENGPFSSSSFRDNFKLLKTTETMCTEFDSYQVVGKVATRTFRKDNVYARPLMWNPNQVAGNAWGPSIGGMIITVYRIDSQTETHDIIGHQYSTITKAETNLSNT